MRLGIAERIIEIITGSAYVIGDGCEEEVAVELPIASVIIPKDPPLSAVSLMAISWFSRRTAVTALL
jgi:hypothetical protein